MKVDSEYQRQKWRLAALRLAAATVGLFITLHSAQALVILQYHHVSTQTPLATSVTPERFAEHMRLIANSGYTVLSLEQVLAAVRHQKTLPDKAVLITFDDGSDSVLEFALPQLKAYGWPFVVFVSTEPIAQSIGGTLSWDELRLLAKNGAAIANHGVTHGHMIRYLENESATQWQQRMVFELDAAEQKIQAETGQNHKAFAYPYGEYSQALAELVADRGYIGFGQHSGAPALRDAKALPRFPFGGDYGDPEDFALKLRALPMPFESVQYRDSDAELLKDGILLVSESRPLLEFTLASNHRLEGLACYASRQGLTEKVMNSANKVSFRAKKPLSEGRSRYNCTAPSGQPGRYYWHSSAFIKPRKDGTWAPEPK